MIWFSSRLGLRSRKINTSYIASKSDDQSVNVYWEEVRSSISIKVVGS